MVTVLSFQGGRKGGGGGKNTLTHYLCKHGSGERSKKKEGTLPLIRGRGKRPFFSPNHTTEVNEGKGKRGRRGGRESCSTLLSHRGGRKKKGKKGSHPLRVYIRGVQKKRKKAGEGGQEAFGRKGGGKGEGRKEMIPGRGPGGGATEKKGGGGGGEGEKGKSCPLPSG